MKRFGTLFIVFFFLQSSCGQIFDGISFIPLNLQIYETKGNHPGIKSSFYVTSTTIRPQLQLYKFVHPRLEIYSGFGTFKFKDKVKIGGSLQSVSDRFDFNWIIPVEDSDLKIASPVTREKYFFSEIM